MSGEEVGHMLYLECQMGIAGDMLVAALLDLCGKPAERVMMRSLESLAVSGFHARVSRVVKGGIDCCDFAVELDPEHENHDHDMTYLHGEGHRMHGRTGHGHRGLAEIEAVLSAADMTDAARSLASSTFRILADAEATAHGVAPELVHFHEVGAVDSIVDIVAASVLIDMLRIDRTVLPALTDGRGCIRCQHGLIPVPVPATLNICIAHGLPLVASDVEGELVTPTGAALVAALDPVFELPARYVVRAAGLGAGKRSYERPSMLRALLIEERPASPAGELPAPSSPATEAGGPAAARATITKLECDIDDGTGEALAYAAERLREAGAREVHWIPILTKKGRPAHQLEVICANGDAASIERVIFRETSTIGVRRQRLERTTLPRAIELVETAWGPIRVKRIGLPDGSSRVKPEYEDCAAAARAHGLPLADVMGAAARAADGASQSAATPRDDR